MVLGKQALMPGFVLEASADPGLKSRPGSMGACKELVKTQTNHAYGLAGETVCAEGQAEEQRGSLLVDGGEVLIRGREGGPSVDSDDKE